MRALGREVLRANGEVVRKEGKEGFSGQMEIQSTLEHGAGDEGC